MGRRLSPVSLVLVTHNSEAHIEASLGILRSDPDGPDEIIVIDNASTDDTVAIVERMGVKLVTLEENHGFAYGCNLGASLTRGEVIAFLNPDTEPYLGWLPPLVKAIDRPGVGAAMPVMDLTYAPDHWFTSGSALTYLGFAWSTHSGEPIPPGQSEKEVPFPSGAAFVISRSLFDHLGGFRDEYFLYLEDVDLGWRLRLMGLKSVQVPESRVAHDYDFERHAHLPAEGLPVEAQRRAGMRQQLHPLAALVIRVEDKPVGIGALEQDHPDGRHAVRTHCRQGHGVGIVGFRFFRLGKPGLEQIGRFCRRVYAHGSLIACRRIPENCNYGDIIAAP